MRPSRIAITSLFILGALAMPARNTASARADQPARVRAPDFTGATGWLNTDKKISIKDLRGQVVILDFWTYCCINCMHIFPDLAFLEEKYKDQPVVILGVHSGKFDQEKDEKNIRQAILRHNIAHPVAVDNDFEVWNAFAVNAWPTLVVIDPEGYVVDQISGEGHRADLDREIAKLLEEGRKKNTLAKPLHFKRERESFKSEMLEFPGKVLADAAGHRLFISDTNHHRVLVTDFDGNIQATIGSGRIGLKDGHFAAAEFHQPQGLALSTDGKTLFIADTENHAVRAADLAAKTVRTLAGTGKQSHEYEPDGPADKTDLSSPWDLALVGDKLFVAMAGTHQIWLIDLKTNRVTRFAGSGREAAIDEGNESAAFAQPSGLATDGKSLWVADAEDSSIRKVDLSGKDRVQTYAGSGDLFGFGRKDGLRTDARFQHPLGVALSGDHLFVADTFNHLIRDVNLKDGKVTTWLGTGKPETGTPDKPGLYEPGGLSIAGDTLFIADTNNHRILAVDTKTKQAREVKLRPPAH